MDAIDSAFAGNAAVQPGYLDSLRNAGRSPAGQKRGT